MKRYRWLSVQRIVNGGDVSKALINLDNVTRIEPRPEPYGCKIYFTDALSLIALDKYHDVMRAIEKMEMTG